VQKSATAAAEASATFTTAQRSRFPAGRRIPHDAPVRRRK
jgi:hypothetical protein